MKIRSFIISIFIFATFTQSSHAFFDALRDFLFHKKTSAGLTEEKKEITKKNLKKKQIDAPLDPIVNYNLGIAQYQESEYESSYNNFERAHAQSKSIPDLQAQAALNAGTSAHAHAELLHKNKKLNEALVKVDQALSWYSKLLESTENQELITVKTEHAQALKRQIEEEQNKKEQDQKQNNKDQQNDQNKENQQEQQQQNKDKNKQDDCNNCNNKQKQDDKQDSLENEKNKQDQKNNKQQKQNTNDQRQEEQEESLDKQEKKNKEDKQQEKQQEEDKKNEQQQQEDPKEESSEEEANEEDAEQKQDFQQDLSHPQDKEQVESDETEKKQAQAAQEQKAAQVREEEKKDGMQAVKQETFQQKRIRALVESLDQQESELQKEYIKRKTSIIAQPTTQGQKTW